MKLELKHLAPYLPYGLKCQLKGNFPISEGQENIIENVYELTIDYIEKTLSWPTCKPILRPLSDLTKEIEVNGKKFVPEFIFDVNNSTIDSSVYLNDEKSRMYFEEFQKYRKHHLDFMPYGMIQQLFEWHFDVFGLIEKGLAIDSNTLK